MVISSKAKITAIGAYIPEKKWTNEDFTGIVDTSDEWIASRTGIKTRYFAAEDEFTSDMALKAVHNLQQDYDKSIEDVDLVIVTTFTADMLTPSVAAIVQGQLGIPRAGVIDLNAACAGFVYGLYMANSMITVGQCNKVLVIASEAMSKIVDFTDRSTCVLFGDGAGAVLLERETENPAFISAYSGANGELGKNLYCTSVAQSFQGEAAERIGKLFQDGRGVYNYVIKNLPKAFNELLNRAGMESENLNWFVPHSANVRMIQSITKKMKFPMEKTLMSVVDYGNTSSASIPLALWSGVKAGKIKAGDTLMVYGFGGGLNHAGLIMKW